MAIVIFYVRLSVKKKWKAVGLGAYLKGRSVHPMCLELSW